MKNPISIGSDRRIDAEAAKRLMPETEAVHTFQFTPFGAMGCDMERAELCRLIDAQQGATLSERGATFDHYLAISVEGRETYLEAVPARVEALLREVEADAGDVVAVPRSFWDHHEQAERGLNGRPPVAVPRGHRARSVLLSLDDPGLESLLADARSCSRKWLPPGFDKRLRRTARRTVELIEAARAGREPARRRA